MFACEINLCLHCAEKEEGGAAADAITMEGVGIRVVMKYKSKTFFQSRNQRASLDGRFERGEREEEKDIRGPPPKRRLEEKISTREHKFNINELLT